MKTTNTPLPHCKLVQQLFTCAGTTRLSHESSWNHGITWKQCVTHRGALQRSNDVKGTKKDANATAWVMSRSRQIPCVWNDNRRTSIERWRRSAHPYHCEVVNHCNEVGSYSLSRIHMAGMKVEAMCLLSQVRIQLDTSMRMGWTSNAMTCATGKMDPASICNLYDIQGCNKQTCFQWVSYGSSTHRPPLRCHKLQTSVVFSLF